MRDCHFWNRFLKIAHGARRGHARFAFLRYPRFGCVHPPALSSEVSVALLGQRCLSPTRDGSSLRSAGVSQRQFRPARTGLLSTPYATDRICAGGVIRSTPYIAAWYPHELLGAPFAANLQNFPLIPTRLILLLLDPSVAYAVGVAIAAALAALFTYLYCRRLGLSEVASITAGWTFACAGYFGCRVTAGHLPLLEAYPALPLLLWLAERALDPRRRSVRSRDRQGAEIARVFSTGPSEAPRSTAPSRSRLGMERARPERSSRCAAAVQGKGRAIYWCWRLHVAAWRWQAIRKCRRTPSPPRFST